MPQGSDLILLGEPWFADLIQLISILVLIATVVILYSQTKDLRKTFVVSSFTAILEQIGSDRARESREKLTIDERLTLLKTKDMLNLQKDELPNIDEDLARYVAVTYDRIAFILKQDPYLEKEILKWHGDVIEDMWLRLRHYIRLKWRTKERPNYVKEFEELGKKAIEFNKNYVPP